MSSSKEYFGFIKEQLSGINGITFRPMMGEYIVYYNGVVIGGIYDDRFLLKITPSLNELTPSFETVSPYPGAKQMAIFGDIDDKEKLKSVILAIYPELLSLKK